MRAAIPLLALGLHAAAQTWQTGDLSLALDAQNRMVVRQGRTTIVNYDQLQLVDPTPKWRVVADLGRQAPGVLACAREVRRDGQAGWELAWEYPAGTGATRCYYFLDLPAALVGGAVCEFETATGKARGLLPNDCAAMTDLRSIRIHGEDLRLDFALGGEGVSCRWPTGARPSTGATASASRIPPRREAKPSPRWPCASRRAPPPTWAP